MLARIGLFKFVKEKKQQLEMATKEESKREHTAEFSVLTMFLHQSLTDTIFPINLIGLTLLLSIPYLSPYTDLPHVFTSSDTTILYFYIVGSGVSFLVKFEAGI